MAGARPLAAGQETRGSPAVLFSHRDRCQQPRRDGRTGASFHRGHEELSVVLSPGKKGLGRQAGCYDDLSASFVGQESRETCRKALRSGYLERMMTPKHRVLRRIESVLSPGKRPRRGQRMLWVARSRPLPRAESPGARCKVLTTKLLRETDDAKDLVI
jgi:hypothetical protein